MEEQPGKTNGEPKHELSKNFAYKIAMGVILLFFAIYFLYLLARIITK
jgi:hypothetical protein